MDIFTTVLIMMLCLLLEGFFSGSEIGVVSADQMKLRHKAAKGSKGAKLALKMLEKPEWLLSTTLVGTNIAVVTNTTMATALMLHLFGDNGSWLAVVLVAPLIWIFGEIVPKSVFQQRADALTPVVIFVLRFFSMLFFPILVVFSFLTNLLTKIAGGDAKNPFTLREQIVTMLQMPASSGGDIHPVEKNMIKRMFNFNETTVNDVMLPLIEVTAVEQGITCGEARKISSSKAHVRLPVYSQRIDRIIGILHTLDLLGMEPDAPITDHIRPAVYVPGGKSIKELMIELRREGTVVAIVVDEFGGAEGIVTIEDIMEEVVENLEDEYDLGTKQRHNLIQRIAENEYLVSARIEIDDLCNTLDIYLPKGNYATLSGLILSRLHSIPAEGTVIKEDDITLTIHRSTEQVIQEVNIKR
ncbi:MAG: HlyC/CorC family transporter [Chromatiaceae bacterium]|nr:HlyC/CorC family transporter [Chromatiaceae bacterium]MCP5408010.1 HlyC/CorC family transporter [Chromatiaceae bacterium]MCP5442909.1 HlyC/CorC family transporter [Chromatiaceae bacterium]